MQILRIADVKVGQRQRKEFKPKPLEELQKTILSKGLLHPIVLTSDHSLVAGERRLRAVKALADVGLTIQHNKHPIPLGSIPFVYITDLSPTELLEAELEENIARVDLSWQEKAEAIANIHRLRQLQNPTQTVRATAMELQAADPSSDVSLSGQVSRVARSLLLADNMDNPEVASAPNPAVAVNRLLAKTEMALRGSVFSMKVCKVSLTN